MLKRLIACLCALTCFSGPVLSQTTCEPAKLVEAIDLYAREPFSARTWRMLKGLGDPMVYPRYRDLWWSVDGISKDVRQIFDEGTRHPFGMSWNCRHDYPLQVLQQRIAQLGKDHAYVKHWLKVQAKVCERPITPSRWQHQSDIEPSAVEGDTVYRRAAPAPTEVDNTIVLPDALQVEPALAELQAQDRAYQEASLAYYRDKPRAIELMRAIGASNSPHRAAARYNVANLLANTKRFAEAREEAKLILADASLSRIHVITKELQGYIANIEDTAEGWSALIGNTVALIEQPLADVVVSEASKHEYSLALYDIDYAGVNGKDDDWWLDGKLPENPTVSKALVDTSHKHPMVLWMMAGQSADEYYRHAAKAAAGAAEKSCGQDPQTAAAGFLLAHAVRLSAMSGNFEEAYAGLEAVPFKKAEAYYNGSVLKFAQYLLGQGNVAEARELRDRLVTGELLRALSARQHASAKQYFPDLLSWIAEDEEHWTQSRTMDWNAVGHPIFNLLPSKKLWVFAGDPAFDQDERAMFARTAWTRDYALGRVPAKDQT
ncbi:MAG: hypothetical protein H7X89_06365, partial [Rhizobiales bacterium]|nr:hypothetical protein [Hyphomicrobiales bacterium]